MIEILNRWTKDVLFKVDSADLCGADLREADLREANLREANLRGANLYEANLRGANLHEADLREADLREANLYEADLREADLCEANLRGADLREADLREVRELDELVAARLSILPAGDIIGYKKCRNGNIVYLLIEHDTRRSNATSRKCRAAKALVLSIFDREGNPTYTTNGQHDFGFYYSVGEYVSVPDFDPDRWNKCAPGIHFFITLEEAKNY